VIVFTVIKEQFPVCRIGLAPVDGSQLVSSSHVCDISVEALSDRLFEELLCYLLFARDRRGFPVVMVEDDKFDFVFITYNDLVFVIESLPTDYRYEVEGQVEIVDDPLPEWIVH